LDSKRLEIVNAMDLDPPYLVQKRNMVEILLSAYNNLCNRVNVPFSEEPLFGKLELLVTTQRMELLSLETSTLRPLTPKPAETQDSIISTNPGVYGIAWPYSPHGSSSANALRRIPSFSYPNVRRIQLIYGQT
jgi:hypothetical protein